MNGEINTPFVLNHAYDRLIQCGTNPDLLWMKQLRSLKDSWAEVTLSDRICSLVDERERLLKTVYELRNEMQNLQGNNHDD